MSTRILALLTTAAAALALAGGVTAANASPGAPPPEPEPAVAPAPAAPEPAASPSGAASPEKGSAKDDAKDEPTDDAAALEECRDAECEIELKDGQEIKLDKGLGAESVKVKVKGTRVTFTVRNQGSRAVTSMDAGQGGNTTANFNGLTLRPHMQDGKLMLELSHA